MPDIDKVNTFVSFQDVAKCNIRAQWLSICLGVNRWASWNVPEAFVFFFTGSITPLSTDLCFQFYGHFTDGRTPWTSDQLVARPLPKHRTTQTQNKHIHTHQTSIPCVGFELTIPASERAKTVHVLDRSATVTGICFEFHNFYRSVLISDFISVLLFEGVVIYSREQGLNSNLHPPIMLPITQLVMSFYKEWYLRSKWPRVAALSLASHFRSRTDMNRESESSCASTHQYG
jgi:hypothetical protein